MGSRVTSLSVGDAVVAVLPLDGEFSGYAERTAVHASCAVKRPSSVDAIVMAAGTLRVIPRLPSENCFSPVLDSITPRH